MNSAGHKPLQYKHALVTGASRGIGRGVAIGLGEAGATVFITGRSIDALEETASLTREAGGKCIPIACDHGNDEDVERCFQTISQYLTGSTEADDASGAGTASPTAHPRRLDLLVNNAYAAASYLAESSNVPFWEKSTATPGIPDPLAKPGDSWDLIMDVGLRSTYVCTIHALRAMLPNKEGLIINMSSIGGQITLFDPLYATGKTANDRLTYELAHYLSDATSKGEPCPIALFTLYPGLVSTELITNLITAQTTSPNAAESESVNRPSDSGGQPALESLMWNAESPLYVGRVVAAIASDTNGKRNRRRHGNIVIAAEAGKLYGVRDAGGVERYSFRSLRTLALSAVRPLRGSPLQHLIPDIPVPWPLIRLISGAIPKPMR